MPSTLKLTRCVRTNEVSEKSTVAIPMQSHRAGRSDQARALYRQILDRYVRPDYAQYRQGAKVGLSAIGGQ
jgi:hypothetical protein